MVHKFSYPISFRREMDDAVLLSDNLVDALHSAISVCQKYRILERIARKSGVSRGSIYHMTSDKANPRIDTVVAIFGALGYEIEVVRKDE